MKTLEELKKRSVDIQHKIKDTFSKEDEEILLMSASYAVFINMLNDCDEQLRFLIYEELKEEFEKLSEE